MHGNVGDVVAWLPHGPYGSPAVWGCTPTEFNPPNVVVGVLVDNRNLKDSKGNLVDYSIAPTWVFIADDRLKTRYYKEYLTPYTETELDFDKTG
jgi:hypothetical protein